MLEIKFIGSGGQGVVFASKLLADALVKKAIHVQTFSSYGYARRGGTVESYVRISEEKIRIHSKIYLADLVIVMDESLVRQPEVVFGIKEGGSFLINTAKPSDNFSDLRKYRVITVEGERIALNHGLQFPDGKAILNTIILGASAALVPYLSIDQLIETIQESKIQAPDKNIEAIREAYDHVRMLMEGKASRQSADKASQKRIDRYPIYRMRTPPCEAHCPAGEPILEALSLIRDGRFKEAMACIREENPFPGVCGRVCYHPCETYCNRSQFDNALAINALERAAFDHGNGAILERPTKRRSTGKRVAVIGAGPAGMTCAYFLSLLGHRVTVFERESVLGGIPRICIPSYRLPRYIIEREISSILEVGVEVRVNTEVGKDIQFEEITEEHHACFIASGAHRPVRLNIPGERSSGVISGLDFLKKVALGDEVHLGKKVAVIGGGNTAVDAARTSKRMGAEEIYIIYRRSFDEMPAYREEVNAAMEEGIEILFQSVPVRIRDNGKEVKKLDLTKTKVVGKDTDGRHQYEPLKGTNFAIQTDTVITALGEATEFLFLPDSIQMNGPVILVDALGRTSLKGVYAGGDATSPTRSVVEAIASGKKASMGIDLYLSDKQEMMQKIRRTEDGAISARRYFAGDLPIRDGGIVPFDDLNVKYYVQLPRSQTSELPVVKRVTNFDEVRLGFSQEPAMREAERCFHCGHCNLCENCYMFCPDVAVYFDTESALFSINRNLCKKCGICIEECPRGVISVEGEQND